MLNRTIKPEPFDQISFTLPEIEKFKLENDLDVFFVRRNHLPILRFNLILESGSKYDPAGKKGMINLFSMLLDEGAGDYDALQLNEEFDLLGSNFDISPNNDNLFISLRTLKENRDESLKLFSDVICRPHLNIDDFAREQRKILTRIMQLNDDPDEIANIVFEYYLFGGNDAYAYPVIGYKNDVLSTTSEDMKYVYDNYFSPSGAGIIVVGDADKDEIKDKLNYYLSSWKTTRQSTAVLNSTNNMERKIILVHKENSVQSEIRIGHLSSKRSSPDYFEKSILNTILGGQFSSRINLNLRENKGYTYGAFSRFNYYKNAAYFFVSTSVNAENTGNAVREIIKELNGIRDGVSEAELDFAKSSLIRKFPSNFETNRQIAANISTLIVHSLPDEFFDSYLENIREISAGGVNKAAAENIFPDDAVIVIVGDKTKLKGQLNEFNREIIEVDLPVV
ncbi:MAG: pitrilysin family protein [Ignavibacteriaceae bacterium]